MAHYIDADRLRAEIKFAKSIYDNPKRVVHGVADAFMQDGRAAMCDDILKKIDSLQQEQAEQDIISLIESRIAEIIGDAQPAPVLRAELRELINKIKEDK